MENNEMVTKGFRILQPLMAGYIARELCQEYHDSWWQEVLMTLPDQIRDLPSSGDYGELVDSLDTANCLRLLDRKWNDVFRKKLSIDFRTWSKELMGVRNRVSHIGLEDFSDDDTWRALDTMARLCEAFDAEAAEEIRSLLRQVRYGSAGGSTAVTSAPAASASALTAAPKKREGVLVSGLDGLPSWRDVIEPHPDVAQGRYKNAEFAADLAQVSRGEGAFEYRDPVEFFARTYVTAGMKGLLVQAIKRVNGQDGEPVIQLKTAFGGGKTHSMLALYHLMRGQLPVSRADNLREVMEEAGVSSLPRANVAVLVGTAVDPTKSRRPINFPGITINTLWGEMAAQIAESAGKPELYDYVRESDRKGVSPGSEVIKNLFDAAAPCLVLMDELVAYAKKLYGVSGLPAGSFDNFITFIQEVTEAARASKNSLVVASIPESEREIGGEAGQIALETIEHTFGRMESVWKPVAANEGFEVVRRRLFLNCKDPAARDLVCSRFSQMYSENSSDFPIEAKEVEYRDRMVSCYPIHPEIFDRLYEDWATLEDFQRTRGVLRLMAAVIHELWMANDAGAMIMPGSIPLDVPNVRDELIRYLPEGWNPIVTSEVDGKSSVPYHKDQEIQRYGQKLAARRVARTIMLGSAPTVRAQTVRGIESSRIRLGTVQPGENIADFNDALNTLQGSLAYLYTNPSGDRFWYDTRPTLRKMVQDRETQIAAPDIDAEIEHRLHSLRKESPFSALHVCPVSSLDVPDDKSARLVILRVNAPYKASASPDLAVEACEDILANRGTSPRIYRNMLAFIAPDQNLMDSLRQGAREYLAWMSVKNDSVSINLDAAQNRETDNNLRRSSETVDARIRETYCWLLTPSIDRLGDMKKVMWDISRLSSSQTSLVAAAAQKMQNSGAITDRWAPINLKRELDGLLWKDRDSLQISQLWDYLCTYCYLPRLSCYGVLEDAIRDGLRSEEYFGIAAGYDGSRYVELRLGQSVDVINTTDLLVKVPAAKKQIEGEKPIIDPPYPPIDTSKSGDTGKTGKPVSSGDEPAREQPPTHFFLSTPVDNTRINRDIQNLVEEVIGNLTTVQGATVEVTLEVTAHSPQGFTSPTVRTVSENCHTLKVKNFGFDQQ